jgi:hypothetical protein
MFKAQLVGCTNRQLPSNWVRIEHRQIIQPFEALDELVDEKLLFL